MISLKKHIDGWTSGEAEPFLNLYRALLLAMAKCSHRAVPGVGRDLERKLSELNSGLGNDLAGPGFPAALALAHKKVLAELADWAERAFARHRTDERELRQIVDAMAKAVQSLADRDNRYTAEAGDLTAKLRAITLMNDLPQIRRSIVESANRLSACVERMAEAGRESQRRLRAEMEDCRSRLSDSERRSSIDPLTGLANRRSFEDLLDETIRTAIPFCLSLIDLNDFKEVNDKLGHLAGDEVLKTFAGRLRDQFAAGDLVARWGGDEFAVIVKKGHDEAAACVDRIRRSSIGECRVVAGNRTVTVNVEPSIGLVQWDGCETGVQLLARADRSMYRGKQSMKTLRMA
jgi:diguanylate cyclase (GGDEF)-like protein